MAFKFNPFTGNLDIVEATSPGGSDTEVQFNDGGAFGGDANFTYNKATGELTLATSGTHPTLDIPLGSMRARYISVGTLAPSTTYDLYLSNASQMNAVNSYIGVGVTPVTTTRIKGGFSSSGNFHKYAGRFTTKYTGTTAITYDNIAIWAEAKNASGGTHGEAIGGVFQAKQDFSNKTISDADGGLIGGKFFANMNSGINGIFSDITLIAGGHFECDMNGGSGNTWNNVAAGRFVLEVAGTDNTMVSAAGLRFDQILGSGTNPIITTAYGIYLAEQLAASAPTLTNIYGIYIEDWTDMSTTLLDAIHIEPQNGANKSVAKGNIYMVGDGFDEGHIQLNTGHIWNNSGNILIKASAPTADGDGVIDIGTTVKVGDTDGTDYSEFEADGTLKFNGAATVWDDYVTPLTKASFGGAANDPTLTKLFDDGAGSAGVWALVFSNGDEVLVTVQMPHKWKEGSDIYPHIHFMCDSDVDPSDNFGIEFEYTWADINEDFPVNSTLETNDIPTGVTTDNMHQLANITSAAISGSGHTISSVLLCRIKRVAATGDDYAGGVAILDFDVHYEIDTVGSRATTSK